MAFDENELRARVRTELLTATPIPPLSNFHWQNRQFTPPSTGEGVSWIRETYFPIAEEHSATQQVTSRWLAVYTVFVGAGFGTELLESTTKGILEVFFPGQWLRGPPNECPFVIERSERGNAVQDPESLAWYMQAVNITIRAHVPNPSLIGS